MARCVAAVCIIGKFLREATKCVKQKMGRRNQIAKTNNSRNCGLHCHIIGLITGISVRLRLCFSIDGKIQFHSVCRIVPATNFRSFFLVFHDLFTIRSPLPSSKDHFSFARHLRASTFLRRRICQAVTVEGKLGQSWSTCNSRCSIPALFAGVPKSALLFEPAQPLLMHVNT